MNRHPIDKEVTRMQRGWRHSLVVKCLGLLIGIVIAVPASATIAQQPLFLVQSARPLVMFAMSMDHQLWKKAYPDYNDLDADGDLETTYLDSFDYFGYFDPNRCYTYSSGVFVPGDEAVGAFNHHCNGVTGDWSGNLLNWSTMTRMDVLRKTLYGGKRSTDTTSDTVLERALLPDDVHSYAKVFTTATTTEMGQYTPYAKTAVSFCNTTKASSGTSENVSTSSSPPLMFVADGSFPRWAADEVFQCRFGTSQSPPAANNLVSSGSSSAALIVRVQVCVSGKEEANCRAYSGSSVDKPSGLLQDYGEDGSLKFGMITGSFFDHDEGGVLRRAIGQLANNPSASDDEIDAADGTFTGNAGIIQNLNDARLNQWDFGAHDYLDCASPGISKSTFDNDNTCTNWGNPLGEIYLEAIRNLVGESNANPTYNSGSDPMGLTVDTWSDPMPSDQWCAPMNIVAISSADNSFDTDHLTNVPSVLGSISTATDRVGTEEGISGDVFIGNNGATADDTCTAKSFGTLSALKGTCPSAPSLEGGYQIAGMAHQAHITDMRTDRGPPAPEPDPGQKIDTFAVALAKELPEFTFMVGGRDVKVLPTCRSNSNGSATLGTSNGWTACSLADLFLRKTVEDGSGNLTYARFLALWEDSSWGNDYDKDGISQISICVGAECGNGYDDDGDGNPDTAVGANQIRVTNRVVNAAAGFALRFGFVISGTTADGLYSNVLRRQVNGDVLDSNNDPTAIRPGTANSGQWSDPDVQVFTAGVSTAMLLDSPLELAAKYGGFTDSNNNDVPDLQSEWDTDNDGLPDNFFFADNPSLLGPKLASFLETLATTSSSASVVANSASLDTNTRIYQARFDSIDWAGQLLSFPVNINTGVLQAAEWDAAVEMRSQNWNTGRNIVTWNPSTGAAIPFRWSSLTPDQQLLLDANPATLGSDGQGQNRLEYLRGNDGLELQNNPSGIFRDRSTPLGAVIHSTPSLVTTPNSGYLDSIEPSRPYSAFKAAQASRWPMIYFGSSDGGLHGVCAEVAGQSCGTTGAGSELFAFIPNSAFGEVSGGVPVDVPLSEYTSPDYAHRYIIDGGITVVDAFFQLGSSWHTLLVGTGAAGGKSVFAIDVTDPTDFVSEATIVSSGVVLWEKTDADLPDLGFTFSQPTVFKAKGDGWVVGLGNGYDSASGKPVVYLLDVRTGAVVKTLVLASSGSESSANGVSYISPVDSDFDGEVDLIYAGDKRGNVWRLEASNSGFGTTGSRLSLLFRAEADTSGTRQPITTRLEVGAHPNGLGGRMVYFGTGKYYETVDGDPATAVSPNTFYGIWDQDSNSTSQTTPTVDSVTNHAANGTDLLRQEVVTTTVFTSGTNSFDIRIVSDTAITWRTSGSSDFLGWFLDLPTTGEKMVANPILRSGRLIFITTIPSLSACEAGGTSWLMEIDPANGGRLDQPVFDLNADGVFDINDYVTYTDGGGNTVTVPGSGKKSKSGILQPPAILTAPGGKKEYKYSSGSKGGTIEITTENPMPYDFGRKSWLQLK